MAGAKLKDIGLPRPPDLILPLLKLLADGKKHSGPSIESSLAEQFHLTSKQRTERGNSTVARFRNHVAWAYGQLVRKGYTLPTAPGSIYEITADGATFLKSNPSYLDYAP